MNLEINLLDLNSFHRQPHRVDEIPAKNQRHPVFWIVFGTLDFVWKMLEVVSTGFFPHFGKTALAVPFLNLLAHVCADLFEAVVLAVKFIQFVGSRREKQASPDDLNSGTNLEHISRG